MHFKRKFDCYYYMNTSKYPPYFMQKVFAAFHLGLHCLLKNQLKGFPFTRCKNGTANFE